MRLSPAVLVRLVRLVRLAWLAGCLVFLTAGPVQAHAGSYDMKYIDGSNLILLTFNTHQPVSGLDIEHNLRLYDLMGAPIPYDDVRVEVHTQQATSGVQGLESSLRDQADLPMLATNESTMSYTYPASGPYLLTTVFTAGGREISRGQFAIDIGRGTAASGGGFSAWWLGAAFLLGAVVSRLLRRRGRRRAPLEALCDPSADPSTDLAQPAYDGPVAVGEPAR